MLMAKHVDLQVTVGDVGLVNPVLAAAGCFGTGAELAGTVDISRLGAVVTKSLSVDPWPGNPPPRLVATDGGGMLNAVGLQNPGLAYWRDVELPKLTAAGVRVVASIWGRCLSELARLAASIASVADRLTALELNLSCPNIEAAGKMFAHDCTQVTAATAAVVGELGDSVAVWAKLSPNVSSVVPYAEAAAQAGAAAVVLTNTVIGMKIDIETRRPHLGNVTGGLSGPPIRPIAVKHIYETHSAMPDLPIVGVGGVVRAEHAVEMLLAGASAVQLGTAHLADPAAGIKCVAGLERWCRRHDVNCVAELTGAAHPGPLRAEAPEP